MGQEPAKCTQRPAISINQAPTDNTKRHRPSIYTSENADKLPSKSLFSKNYVPSFEGPGGRTRVCRIQSIRRQKNYTKRHRPFKFASKNAGKQPPKSNALKNRVPIFDGPGTRTRVCRMLAPPKTKENDVNQGNPMPERP